MSVLDHDTRRLLRERVAEERRRRILVEGADVSLLRKFGVPYVVFHGGKCSHLFLTEDGEATGGCLKCGMPWEEYVAVLARRGRVPVPRRKRASRARA